ncbi:putative nuclease HARBI1 [Triplophysa rosa]|uniref:Putative nuclease HARBI1 n=1 Tax=Triplophysa rosa TaxID=992332 RepID=A0A9W8CB88_TRIRA|nr:putative nuclease HARBI1 [Triplophysa rosa]KAI7813805.1 putative nuclease HARBI1-like [Triplophysa rosa]
MASPFLESPVDIGAQIVKRAFREERVLRDRQNPLAFPDDYLYERYRFSAEGIVYLCRLLERHIKNPTRRSQAISVPQMLCIALRFFTSGTYLYAVGDAEKISKNTVCRTIRRVVIALQRYINTFIVFPGHLPTVAIKEGFHKIAGFPKVIGAIDCTHIAISKPVKEIEADYIDKKFTHSLNVQMTCDHQCMVTSLDARWPGSVHDSQIFNASVLYQRFKDGLYDGILVGDRAYACQSFLMSPYQNPETRPQHDFNMALGQTGLMIKRTFGILKSRFGCLRDLRVSPERASQIVGACVVLHNIATTRKEAMPQEHHIPPDDVDPVSPDHPAGRAMRDNITTQYF